MVTPSFSSTSTTSPRPMAASLAGPRRPYEFDQTLHAATSNTGRCDPRTGRLGKFCRVDSFDLVNGAKNRGSAAPPHLPIIRHGGQVPAGCTARSTPFLGHHRSSTTACEVQSAVSDPLKLDLNGSRPGRGAAGLLAVLLDAGRA
jgi:hypothetical protein